MSHPAENGLPEFWISWYSPEPMSAFELHSPWWVSGYTDTENIVVAAVRAESESAAWAQVRDAYDYAPELRERFIEPLTGSPFSGRFPKSDWMAWDDERTCGCDQHSVLPPADGCLCLFEDGVIVRTDDLCPLHSKRPGVRVLPPEGGNA